MTAPSLILLDYGSQDPRVSQVSQAFRAGLQQLRPGLDIQIAFLDRCAPALPGVIKKLLRNGVEEVVLVPLSLSDAFEARAAVPAVTQALQAAHSALRVRASRPIGPEAALLSIVDRRLREALRTQHVTELDALVLAAAGSADIRSNALIARRARQWAAHHKLPCLTALASGTGPTAGEAVRALRVQGKRHVAVGSWFLSPGLSYVQQADEAHGAGAVAIADPLGAEPEIAEIVLTRYLRAAMELVDVEPASAHGAAVQARHLSVVSA